MPLSLMMDKLLEPHKPRETCTPVFDHNNNYQRLCVYDESGASGSGASGWSLIKEKMRT